VFWAIKDQEGLSHCILIYGDKARSLLQYDKITEKSSLHGSRIFEHDNMRVA
jgi:hypothetical protein